VQRVPQKKSLGNIELYYFLCIQFSEVEAGASVCRSLCNDMTHNLTNPTRESRTFKKKIPFENE
jgi:hypothetical protein